MRILIENYKGWDITFDTYDENFYSVSNEYHANKLQNSYSAAKKYIDKYIEENQTFQPIRVARMATRWSNNEEITLIGITKDNQLMYEDAKGNRKLLSKYDEGDFFLVNPDSDNIFKELDLLYKEGTEISEKIRSTKAKLIKLSVKEHLNRQNNNNLNK